MAESIFTDRDAFAAATRVIGLHLSPDGTVLVAEVAHLDAKATGYLTALWAVDPQGAEPARRLTRSTEGESFGGFLAGSTLMFTSRRPNPLAVATGDAADTPRTGLWVLPAHGEAYQVTTRSGGVDSVVGARSGATIAMLARTMPGTGDGADETTDAGRRGRRATRKVTAILHSSYPVRFWDSDLGPDGARLLVANPIDDPGLLSGGTLSLRDLTGDVGQLLREAELQLSPDGTTVYVTVARAEAGGSTRSTVLAVDVDSGQQRVMADQPAVNFGPIALSPDGSRLAVVMEERPTPERAGDTRLAVIDVTDPVGIPRPVAAAWDRWPLTVTWSADGSALFVTADQAGRCPVFRVDVTADAAGVVQLTGDDAAYSHVHAAPDGERLFALRAAIDAPPAPVVLDTTVADQRPHLLLGPTPPPRLPGRVEEVTATALDGTPLRAWLCLPGEPADDSMADSVGASVRTSMGASGSDPAAESAAVPLALWIHGGPLASWNSWSWRWNPWVMVARGYAVLLPDPALSTGYGAAFIARGWGAWGDHPYTDVIALTDAAAAHPGVDPTRQAVMGGSFGGYLTNWILGHTDRFAVGVTHAGIYALDQFARTTDVSSYWAQTMTAAAEQTYSPHRHVDQWSTPTLVIHGDHDYRVPIGEALRLWWDLAERSGESGSAHRFLYFPDEAHWVLSPEHSKIWYDTVLAFVDHHVKGTPWQTPDLLR